MKKQILIALFTAIWINCAFGQQKQIDSLTLVINNNPSDPVSYLYRSHYYLQMNQKQLAKRDLINVLRIDSTNVGALINVGFLYGEINQVDSAIYYLKKSSRLNDSNAKLGAFMSLGFYLNETGDFESALQKSDSALIFATDERVKGSIYNNKGFSYYNLEELDSAAYYYRLAEEKYPDNPYLMKNIGLVKLKENDHKSACNYFQSALKFDKGHFITNEVKQLINKNCK